MQMGLILVLCRDLFLQHYLLLQTSTGCSHQARWDPQQPCLFSEQVWQSCWGLCYFCFQFIDWPRANHVFCIPLTSVARTVLMKPTSVWYLNWNPKLNSQLQTTWRALPTARKLLIPRLLLHLLLLQKVSVKHTYLSFFKIPAGQLQGGHFKQD